MVAGQASGGRPKVVNYECFGTTPVLSEALFQADDQKRPRQFIP